MPRKNKKTSVTAKIISISEFIKVSNISAKRSGDYKIIIYYELHINDVFIINCHIGIIKTTRRRKVYAKIEVIIFWRFQG